MCGFILASAIYVLFSSGGIFLRKAVTIAGEDRVIYCCDCSSSFEEKQCLSKSKNLLAQTGDFFVCEDDIFIASDSKLAGQTTPNIALEAVLCHTRIGQALCRRNLQKSRGFGQWH